MVTTQPRASRVWVTARRRPSEAAVAEALDDELDDVAERASPPLVAGAPAGRCGGVTLRVPSLRISMIVQSDHSGGRLFVCGAAARAAAKTVEIMTSLRNGSLSGAAPGRALQARCVYRAGAVAPDDAVELP